MIVLNSNLDEIDEEEQEEWLDADLHANPDRCTVAYFHHARFSSGMHGNQSQMQPIWAILYDHDVDVVLSAHDHDYERFAPQSPTGVADPERGIRQFVVGTGGDEIRPFERIRANSEFRNDEDFGVLRLTLRADEYTWEFLAAPNARVVDSGTGQCH